MIQFKNKNLIFFGIKFAPKKLTGAAKCTKLMKQNADNKRKLDDNCSRNSENLRKTARGKKLRKKRKSHKIKAISRYGKKN